MDQQVMPLVPPAFEAKVVGRRLASQELDDEPSPFTLSVIDPIWPQRPMAKSATRPSTAGAAAVSRPWTPSMETRRSRRRLEMPAVLARLIAGGPGAEVAPAAAAEDAELECYLLEGGGAYRRQRLPFGQGQLARGLARRGADALWDNYMALDAGQKAGVDRLLRRKTRTSTRPRTCVAIAPLTGPGGDEDRAVPHGLTAPIAEGAGGAATAAKCPSFLVFLAVGRSVASVRFRDPLGRRFEFSFELCRTWAGMEDLLLDCFPRVDEADNGPGAGASVDTRVRRGHYDLLGPDGHIVLPMVWESVVRPGWRVSMVLWPQVFARARPLPPPGPPGAPAASGGLWRKALGALRAPFERARPGPSRRAGPAGGGEREASRELWVLDARVPEADAHRRASLARFASPAAVARRHSSDVTGDARSWYAASLPRHMASPAHVAAPGRRLSPVPSEPPPDEGSVNGSASSRDSSSRRTCPSGGTDRSDGDDGASRISSVPDCASEALDTVSLGKGIDDLLGRWTSAGVDMAHEADTAGKASGGRAEAGSVRNGE